MQELHLFHCQPLSTSTASTPTTYAAAKCGQSATQRTMMDHGSTSFCSQWFLQFLVAFKKWTTASAFIKWRIWGIPSLSGISQPRDPPLELHVHFQRSGNGRFRASLQPCPIGVPNWSPNNRESDDQPLDSLDLGTSDECLMWGHWRGHCSLPKVIY